MLFAFSGCISYKFDQSLNIFKITKSIDLYSLFNSTSPHSKGSVIIIHGLNLAPHKMDPLAKIVSQAGFNVYRINLTAHRKNSAILENPSSNDWINDLKQTYDSITKEDNNLPISIIAYSLGAPLTLQFLEKYPDKKIKDLIFIAPALSLKGYISTIRFLLPLRFLGISLPSFSPVDYRHHSRTSLYAYKAFFDLYDKSKLLSPNNNVRNSKLTIFTLKNDELISNTGLKLWLRENNLKDAQIKEISHNISKSDIPKHLAIDSNSLGVEEWLAFTSDIICSLSKNSK